MRFLLLILLLSHALCAQITFKDDWVNKRTNQWLTNSYCKGPSKCYDLITKSPTQIEVKPLKISDKQFDAFKDSLKRSGFKAGATLTEKNEKYAVSMELESINLETVTGQDSIFKFRYKITLKDKKQRALGERFLTRMGNDKIKAYKALRDHSYIFRIHSIKGTSIISVELASDDLLFPDTKYKPGVFSYCPDFYF